MRSKFSILFAFAVFFLASCGQNAQSLQLQEKSMEKDSLVSDAGCLGLPAGTKSVLVSIDSMMNLEFEFARDGQMQALSLGTSFSKKRYQFDGNRLESMRQTDRSFFDEDSIPAIVTDYVYEYVHDKSGETFVIECDTLHNHLRTIATCTFSEDGSVRRILRSDGTLYLFSEDAAGNILDNLGRPVIAKAFLLIDYSPHVSTVRPVYDMEGNLKGMVSRKDSTISLRFTYY